MDKKQTQFEEQEAPLKNTDNAFVQVNKDGSPVIPEPAERNSEDQEKEDALDFENR